MKRVSFLATVLVASALLSCRDTKDDLRDPLSEKDIYKTIGEEIPFETGMEWIEFYKSKKNEQGRLEGSPYFNLPALQLKSMLASSATLVGVAFHYAIDDAGGSHIVAIPVDESMTLWSGAPERIILDANTEAEINKDVAFRWAQRYKDTYPDETWFHFFGKNIFDDMVALPFFNNVEIEPAINVADLTPQLLLVVINNDLVSSGRTATSNGVVYDASNACPPCAVE